MNNEPAWQETEEEEGAPLWIVTFADLMSLLLCFFILLLSFSVIDDPLRTKVIIESLTSAFGVQRNFQVVEPPKGQNILAKVFDQEIIASKTRREIRAARKREAFAEELMREVETNFQDIQSLIQVDVSQKRITIRLMGGTAFDSGKAGIRKQITPLLEKIGSALKKTTGDLIISGHTDNVPIKGGVFSSNLQLSTARATAVAEFLIKQIFIKPQRIATMGFGEYRPLESNDTPEDREKNRRVEIILTVSPFRLTE